MNGWIAWKNTCTQRTFRSHNNYARPNPRMQSDRLQNKILLFIAVRWPTGYALMRWHGTITYWAN
jgi:hypothetical protein